MESILSKAIGVWYDHCFSDIRQKEEAAKTVGDLDAEHDFLGELSIAIRKEYSRKESLFPRGEIWDFTQERRLPVFTVGSGLILRPVNEDDLPEFSRVRNLGAMSHKDTPQKSIASGILSEDEINEALKKALMDSVRNELTDEKSFIVAIINQDANQFVGYVSIKDTAVPIWEIAIELLPEWCGKGCGPAAIREFLSAVNKITGKNEFRALVELDNYRSQHCMKKAGAKLTGLFDTVFGDPAIAELFENENTDLITPQIIELANELQLEPKKLLSKVLDYHFYF